MRSAILAAALAAAGAPVPGGPAKAQWTVICANCEPETNSLVRWGKQAADMTKQIQQGEQRYRQLVSTYESMTRITDLGSAVAFLNQLGIRLPMGSNPVSVANMLSGYGASGAANQIPRFFQTALGLNAVYQPRGSWTAEQMLGNQQALAGTQAVAMQIMQSAADRVPGLDQLRTRINAAQDPSEREALIARLQAETAYIANAQTEAQAVLAYSQAQAGVRQQQQDERMMAAIDRALEDARRRGWWNGPATPGGTPATTPGSPTS